MSFLKLSLIKNKLLILVLYSFFFAIFIFNFYETCNFNLVLWTYFKILTFIIPLTSLALGILISYLQNGKNIQKRRIIKLSVSSINIFYLIMNFLLLIRILFFQIE